MNGHRAWILVDPVQCYEESTEILGVYATDVAARAAALEGSLSNWRDLEVQEWVGAELVVTWRWDRLRKTWERW